MTKRLQQHIVGALAVACAVPMTADACGIDPYIGDICMTAASYCANGYVEANGQLLAIQSNPALYSLLGTTFGGDGQTTFGVPDMRGRSPLGIGQGTGLSNVAPGQKRGQESVTLTAANLAPHNHAATYTPTGGGAEVDVKVPVSSKIAGNTIAPDATHAYLAASPTGQMAAAIWADQMVGNATVSGVTASVTGGVGTVTVGNTGNASPVATLPPQIGLRFCVAVTGNYPTRP